MRRPTLLELGAFVVFLATVAATTIAAATSGTLGYDFDAYRAAGARLLAGEPLYDPTIATVGPAGAFLYPPPVALLMAPVALLPGNAALVLWTALVTGALLAAILLMPVPARIRALVLLLAALDWPALYAVKLGQVGPLLLLLFVVAWRRADRPALVAVLGAVGGLVKVQPLLLVARSVLRAEWRAVAIGGAVLAGVAALATLATGPDAWADYLALTLRIGDPITHPRAVTVGGWLHRNGLGVGEATLVQAGVVLATLVVVAVAALRRPAATSVVVTAVASQLVSPVLWDHYAVMLLVPIAWLLARRAWWAAAFPLATSVVLIGVTPDIVYVLSFPALLVAVAGRSGGPDAADRAAGEPDAVDRAAAAGPAARGPEGDPVLSSRS